MTLKVLDKVVEDDYATKFKSCIEDNNIPEAKSILRDWKKEYPNDANAWYATAIIEATYPLSTQLDVLKICDLAKHKTPVNTGLEGWYKEFAYNAFSKRTF